MCLRFLWTSPKFNAPVLWDDFVEYDRLYPDYFITWSVNQRMIMMTSSNGNIFKLLAFCAGYSPITGEFHAQWRGTLMFSLTCAWTNSWANTGDSCDLRRHCTHYDTIVMWDDNGNGIYTKQTDWTLSANYTDKMEMGDRLGRCWSLRLAYDTVTIVHELSCQLLYLKK